MELLSVNNRPTPTPPQEKGKERKATSESLVKMNLLLRAGKEPIYTFMRSNQRNKGTPALFRIAAGASFSDARRASASILTGASLPSSITSSLLMSIP